MCRQSFDTDEQYLPMSHLSPGFLSLGQFQTLRIQYAMSTLRSMTVIIHGWFSISFGVGRVDASRVSL